MTPDQEHQIHTITFPNGQKYMGELKNGKMHGKGKMSSPDGPTYEGDWENGVMHGYGTLTWPGGNKESGWWERGNFKGEQPPKSPTTLPSEPLLSSKQEETKPLPSQKSSPSSLNFETFHDYTIKKQPIPTQSSTPPQTSPNPLQRGTSKGDSQGGQSPSTPSKGGLSSPLKENSPFSKPFASSSESNITKFFDYDYTIKKTSSKSNTSESQASIAPVTSSFNIKVPKSNLPSFSDSIPFDPPPREDNLPQPPPKGDIREITFPNGQKYVGELKNGKMHGKGKMSSPDGPTYEGNWENGVMHGYGTLTWPGGNKESGWWERGNFKGEQPPKSSTTPPSEALLSSKQEQIKPLPTQESSPSSLNFETSYDYTIKKQPPPALSKGGQPPLTPSKGGQPSLTPSKGGQPPPTPSKGGYATGPHDYKVKKSSPLKELLPTSKSSGFSKSEETVFAPDNLPQPPPKGDSLPQPPPKGDSLPLNLTPETLSKGGFFLKPPPSEGNLPQPPPKGDMKTITFPNGQKYVGELKNGKMHGKGKMSSPDGPTYEGDWENGVMHGYGTLTWPGGNKESGWWERGNFKGEQPPTSL